MKIINPGNKVIVWCIMLILMLYSMAAYTDNSIIPVRGGRPFSDPSGTIDMPSSWVQMPVRPEREAGAADVTVNLDQHIYPVLLPLIQQFARENKIRIAVSEGTCGTAAGLLSRKAVDVAGFCCPPDRTDRLPGLRFHTYGIAALAILVHPDNPVENITTEETRKIFSGEITSWTEIGAGTMGRDGNSLIQPVTRLHCKIRPGHWRLLLDNQDLFSPRILDVGAIPDMIYNVSHNKNTVGFEILWNVERFLDKGRVKPLKLNGYSPFDREAIVNHNYPFYEVFSLSAWHGEGVENPMASELVEYIVERSRGLADKYHFVHVSQLRKGGWKFRDDELVGEPD